MLRTGPFGESEQTPLLRRYGEVFVSPSHLAPALLMVTIWGHGAAHRPFGESEQTPCFGATARYS